MKAPHMHLILDCDACTIRLDRMNDVVQRNILEVLASRADRIQRMRAILSVARTADTILTLDDVL